VKGALPQVQADAGTHQGAKAKRKGTLERGGSVRGLFPASKAVSKKISGIHPASPREGSKVSFADALKSRLDAEGVSLEKLLKSVEAAIKSLKKENPSVSVFGKILREIMEDRRLDPRQKADRLKKLLAEIKENQASPAQAPGLAVKAQAAGPMKQETPAKENISTTPVDASRKPAGPRVYVLDLRKNAQANKGGVSPEGAKGIGSQGGLEKSGHEPVFPILKAQPEYESQRAPRAPSAPRTGADMTPAERLREMAGSELARAAGIVLRDGGSGEIRLVLKPESLGSVRVRLNLADNVIDGKIFVDNPEVKHVLEGSLDSLTRALSADGFQTASLQVSVSGDGAGTERRDREPLGVVRIETQSGFANAVPDAEGLTGWDDLLVNLFA
jgi:hypothetical protein